MNCQRKFVVFMFSLTFFSCTDNNKSKFAPQKDFIEKVVDFQVNNRSNDVIELPDIYDSLVADIPNDNSENLMLVKALKKRGFTVVDWSRGNYPPLGPRIVSFKLMKDSCLCEVNKIYYHTSSDSFFRPSESIRCSGKR